MRDDSKKETDLGEKNKEKRKKDIDNVCRQTAR